MKHFPRKRRSEAEIIEAEASEWIAARDAGFDVAASAQFAAWCASDPRHAAAVTRLEATWNALQGLRDYRPNARAHPDPDLLAPVQPDWGRRVLMATAALPIAAAVAFALLWSWSSVAPKDAAPKEHVYATTAGGYTRVVLEDGSVAELNSNTELAVAYSDAERHVSLRRGEAHFTVAQSKVRPFWVEADGVRVRAVGTAFDVRMASEGIEVLVTAGTVQLSRTHAVAQQSQEPSQTPLLTAGWRAMVPRGESIAPRVEKVASPIIRNELAWQSSRLVFADMPLGEVVEQFNQRNEVQITFADPKLAKLVVGGSFSSDNVDAFLRLLASNGDIIAEQRSPQEVVLRSRAP